MKKPDLLESFYFIEGVYFQRGLDKKEAFERKYISIREKEKRIYTDEQVGNLPHISSSHPHYHEWCLRNDSMQRLINYVKKKKFTTMLDIGCGNGWLSSQLAKTEAEVFALDVNEAELKQGSRVFKNMNNLTFLYADVLSNPFKADKLFDLIVLSSSLQYFPEVSRLIQSLQSLLSVHGEIHILDTPIYQNENEAILAKKRSESYFNAMEHSWMNHYYFHHTLEKFRSFNYKILYNPTAFPSRIKNLFSKTSPFPWLAISEAQKA